MFCLAQNARMLAFCSAWGDFSDFFEHETIFLNLDSFFLL